MSHFRTCISLPVLEGGDGCVVGRKEDVDGLHPLCILMAVFLLARE